MKHQDDGTFIMYYAAKALDGGRHCVGAAISSAINQPFQPLPDPMFCPEGMGGAIDPSGFRDVDGQRYVVYKIDGNSIGHGGSCNNFIGPIVPTPIVLQKVGDDGIQQIGNATVILDRDASDGPLVEAPTLMQRDGLYYLFYSSNCWSSTNYDVGIAIAPSLQGPYEKMSSLLQTGMDGLTAPGGASVAADGEHFVFHANNGNHRSLHVAMVSAGGAPTQR